MRNVIMRDWKQRCLTLWILFFCVPLVTTAQHDGFSTPHSFGAGFTVPAPALHPYDEWGRPNPDAFDWTGAAIGGSLGTTGIGVEGTFFLTDWLNFRVTGNYLSMSYKTTSGRIDYEYDYTSVGTLFLLDFYPGFFRSFRVSAGLTMKDTEVSIRGESRGNLVIGGNNFTPAQLGRLRGKASYDTFAPYIGVGFGNPVHPDSLVTFFMDFGLLFQGYSLRLSSDGTAPNQVKEAGLRELRSDITDKLDWLKIYPVITAGIAYHF